jgi:hypothetical protein
MSNRLSVIFLTSYFMVAQPFSAQTPLLARPDAQVTNPCRDVV